MKNITVEATWQSTHTVEVPDDFEPDSGELPGEVFDQMTSATAELVDWTVHRG